MQPYDILKTHALAWRFSWSLIGRRVVLRGLSNHLNELEQSLGV